MKKIIIKLLLRWYVNRLDGFEITKLSGAEELKAYAFRDVEMTEKLVKTMLTAQTLWHFEANNEEERLMAKGAAMMLKYLKDAHNAAVEVYDSQDIDGSLKKWSLYKRKHRIN